MILIIEIYNNRFHYFEFVKPIEDLYRKNEIEFTRIHYKNLTEKIISKADKVIIAGTSLKDNGFIKDIDEFQWIKEFDKPILGICGGMHILGSIYNGKLEKRQEIGLTEVKFKKEFIGIDYETQVYELHNFYVDSEEFQVFAESKKCSQAIKHKKKPFYGVLFHPEVRNKDLLVNFYSI